LAGAVAVSAVAGSTPATVDAVAAMTPSRLSDPDNLNAGPPKR
jgi:hypothetical protein